MTTFKILVAVKRVVDFNVKIRIKADCSGVETANVKMSMNPFDEIAVEEAVRLKEKQLASEIVVASIGTDPCQEILRVAFAMGADRGIHIKTEQELQPLSIAKILAWIAKRENPQLILMGKQAIDDDCNQTGQMLAALLNWPQATFASKIVLNNSTAEVTREIDDGLEILQVKLPAVVTTDLRLNVPRYITLPNIMKAKQKSIEKIALDSLHIDVSPRLSILHVASPPLKKPGIILSSASELVDKLQNEAKVL
jgi:electron transfer flavoprotein beta subunit